MSRENELATIVVNCCYRVHKSLGPGLLETVYEEVLSYELKKQGVSFERQLTIPVVYESVKLNTGFRADIIVEKCLILEIKSIEMLAPVHQKQLLTYLRLTNIKLGLLINFNTSLIKDGLQRIVNGLK